MSGNLGVILHHEVVDDEVLTLGGVFTHIELQQLRHSILLPEGHAVKAHIWPDEVSELVGRDFAQTFESGDFGVVAKAGNRVDALLVGVAVV